MARYAEERGEKGSRFAGGGSRRHHEDEDNNRRRGQEMRVERAARAGHDREGHSQDMGQGGWFGDAEGHSQAARRGWDNPSHGESGWFGDAEGHSDASRRGWDNPGHRPSGWFGDAEGHSQAARRGWGEESRGGRYDEEETDGRRSRRSRYE